MKKLIVMTMVALSVFSFSAVKAEAKKVETLSPKAAADRMIKLDEKAAKTGKTLTCAFRCKKMGKVEKLYYKHYKDGLNNKYWKNLVKITAFSLSADVTWEKNHKHVYTAIGKEMKENLEEYEYQKLLIDELNEEMSKWNPQSEREKAFVAALFIADRMSYKDRGWAHDTSFKALYEKKAWGVCADYSTMTTQWMKAAGCKDCGSVISDHRNHAWNYVRENGETYHFDNVCGDVYSDLRDWYRENKTDFYDQDWCYYNDYDYSKESMDGVVSKWRTTKEEKDWFKEYGDGDVKYLTNDWIYTDSGYTVSGGAY